MKEEVSDPNIIFLTHIVLPVGICVCWNSRTFCDLTTAQNTKYLSIKRSFSECQLRRAVIWRNRSDMKGHAICSNSGLHFVL